MRHVILLCSLINLAAGTTPVFAQGNPQAAPPAAAPLRPAEQELIYQGEATSILGRQVRDPAGEVVGRVVDVLVDASGEPRAAVIDFGGFMGIGSRTIAVAWRALHFMATAGNGAITLDMTQDQIKATPDYHRPAKPEDAPVAVAAPPHAPAPAATGAPPP